MNVLLGLTVALLATNAMAHPDAHPGHEDAHHADLPNYPTATALPTGLTPVLAPDQENDAPSSDAQSIAFDEFFLPPGRRGLEFTERAKALEGSRVRITGFMVRRCNHVPGQMMLTLRPVTLHEHEMGFADDLPMATIFVIAPTHDQYTLPFVRVPLTVEGTLELGNHVEPDGRVSAIRIVLDGDAGSYTQSQATQTAGAAAAEHEQHDDHDHEQHSH